MGLRVAQWLGRATDGVNDSSWLEPWHLLRQSCWRSSWSLSRSRRPNPELITPASAAPFPAQLPSAEGLPPLAEAPMSAASAAYVVDGEVVLVNAATAEAVTAFASEEDIPASLSGSSGATRPSITGEWSSVALSPDGRMLLMTVPRYMGTEGLQGQLLYLLDIGAGTTQRLQDLTGGGR